MILRTTVTHSSSTSSPTAASQPATHPPAASKHVLVVPYPSKYHAHPQTPNDDEAAPSTSPPPLLGTYPSHTPIPSPQPRAPSCAARRCDAMRIPLLPRLEEKATPRHAMPCHPCHAIHMAPLPTSPGTPSLDMKRPSPQPCLLDPSRPREKNI